ncbi:MAG: hypothetical protein ACYCUV_11730, partial [Phycisphaerae bacterium]
YTTAGRVVNATLVSGLAGPIGIAVSGKDLFVVVGGTGTVGEYTVQGHAVKIALISGLRNPFGLTLVGNKIFVVEERTGGTIGEYTTSGRVINAALATGLDYPGFIAVSNRAAPE